MTTKWLVASSFFLLLAVSNGLDVELVSTTCDESLPVTADIYLQCSTGGARCTFGESSEIYGSFYYNGVAESGVENNVAYMTADLSLWAMDFNLCDMRQVPLCYETMVAGENNQNDCPGDGEFEYSINYQLPGAGNQAASWLATGWQGSGRIRMYAEPNENMMIGDCRLELKTYVTQQEDTLVGTPSAAIAAGISLAVVLMIGLCCCYWSCCRRNKRKITTVTEEENLVDFERLEEEKSYWSGGSKNSKKSNKTKSSGTPSIVSEL